MTAYLSLWSRDNTSDHLRAVDSGADAVTEAQHADIGHSIFGQALLHTLEDRAYLDRHRVLHTQVCLTDRHRLHELRTRQFSVTADEREPAQPQQAADDSLGIT